MSERVSLVYDDGSKTDFNSYDDLLFHVDRQGLAGVVNVVAADEDGLPTDEVVATREELNDRTQEEKTELADTLTAENATDEGGEE